jgi:hypothetical protein
MQVMAGNGRPTTAAGPRSLWEAAALVHTWLVAGTELAGGIAADDRAATWLHAVATLLERKQLARGTGPEHVN